MIERWSLAAGFVPDVWAVVLLTICGLLAAAEGVWAFRKPTASAPRSLHAAPRLRGHALAILGLRFLSVAALLGIAFELTLRVEQVAPAGRRVVVLVDRSASMDLADARDDGSESARRQQRVEDVWRDSADARGRWAEEGLIVDVRGFDTETIPYAGELAETLHVETPDGAGSDLGRALTELAEPQPHQRTPLSAVIVISDGLVASDGAADRHLDAVADAIGVPVTTVSTGAPAITDVSVADVKAGEFAFVENVTEIEATIIAHGLRGKGTQVSLLRDGEAVHKRKITLLADSVPMTVRFEVAPDRIGQFVYEVVVEELPGEATVANNRRAFVVKVLRDKVRVLHVAGRPDWDVRALRTLLRRDPNVELLSYYILRGFDDISREDTTAPLSLIPFPTDELFEEQLGSFDLVILHNFDAVQHSVAQYIENIAQYVVEGGAVVLIGGDLGLSDGGYAPSTISSLLPVDTREMSELEHGRFRPTVTEAGRRHPITAWLSGTTAGWESLPELDTFNTLTLAEHAERIGSAVLLEHPTTRNRDGSPAPLLAVAEPGKGRTMVLATGSTWRLGFAPELPLIDGARPYDLLWLGAVRWLLRDDSSGRLVLETDKPRYRVGEPVELQATTLSGSYAPEPEVEVQWEVLPLANKGTEVKPLQAGRWVTDALGRARETIVDLPVGSYAAVARRELGDDGEVSDPGTVGEHEVRRVFIVEPPGRELAKVDADPGIDRLRKLAEATEGEFIDALDGEALPVDLPVADPEEGPDAHLRVDGRRDIAVWNGWIALVMLVISFGGEWLLRRRTGHV